jgi:hypothetical protein
MREPKISMKSAWIIEWECGPGKELPKRKIVAVFPGRTSAERVVEAMRVLDMARQLTPAEHVHHASHRLKRGERRGFEPVCMGRIGRMVWPVRFTTSSNPWLYGHLVKNVRVIGDEPDTSLTYEEVEPPAWAIKRAAEEEEDARRGS